MQNSLSKTLYGEIYAHHPPKTLRLSNFIHNSDGNCISENWCESFTQNLSLPLSLSLLPSFLFVTSKCDDFDYNSRKLLLILAQFTHNKERKKNPTVLILNRTNHVPSRLERKWIWYFSFFIIIQWWRWKCCNRTHSSNLRDAKLI